MRRAVSGGRRRRAFGRRRLAETPGQFAPQRLQSLIPAGYLEQRVAFQRQRHHVAAQRGFGIFRTLRQLAQSVEARTQAVERLQIDQRLGQPDAGRHHLRVVGQHAERLAAELLRLRSHAAEAFARVDVQRDQAGERGFQRGQRLVHGGQLFVGKREGNEVLRHDGFQEIARSGRLDRHRPTTSLAVGEERVEGYGNSESGVKKSG